MRRVPMLFTALFVATSAASAHETLISECNVYPEFRKEAIRRFDPGPSFYGQWYYDLVFKNVRQVLVHGCGGTPITQTVLITERFTADEPHGTKAILEKDVRAYLAAHEIDRCP